MTNTYRKITSDTALDTKVLVCTSFEGGLKLDGVLRGWKDTPLHKLAIIEVGGETYGVHPAAVEIAPLGTIEGKPVYSGDAIFLREYGIYYACTAVSATDGRLMVDARSVPGVRSISGRFEISRFVWELGMAQASHTEPDMFINVYETLPNGERKFPGSTVFYDVAEASNTKHNAPLIGTYKLVRCNE